MPNGMAPSRFRQWMPHPAPCWCKDCYCARHQAHYATKHGRVPGEPPTARPCEGCGWLFVPIRHTTRWCSQKCFRAARGSGAFPDSSRVHFSSCYTCGVFLRAQNKKTPVARCEPCRLKGQVDRNRRKNAKRRGARVGLWFSLQQVGDRDGWRCHLCGRRVDKNLSGKDRLGPTIDHLVPISAGGMDVLENVRLAHRSCNITRGAGGSVQLLLVG